MKKISEVTRRNIFDMFETGIVLDGGLSSSNQTGKEEILRMSLYGRLDEISFLERIFVRAGLIFTTRGQENSYHHIAA